MNLTIDNLAQIIRKVDGDHSLGADALAEAILDELRQQQSLRRGPKPGREQRKVLEFFIANGGVMSEERIPRRVSWYAGDVIKRLVGRGWIAPTKTSNGCFEITEAGKKAVGQ